MLKKNQLKFLVLGIVSLLFNITTHAQNPSSVSGKIIVDNATFTALNAQQGQNLLKSGIVFEVWSVIYRDIKNDNDPNITTRVYLNTKQPITIAPSLSKEGSNTVINFVAKNIPQQGSYIVLYYFNSYPPQFKTFKPGSQLNDGTNRTDLQYATNALVKIGKDKKYGVFSINPVNQSQTYTTNLTASTSDVMVAGFWGSLGDFFGGVAKFVWEGGKTLAGVVVDATGTVIVQGYGITQALVTEGVLPNYREITDSEYKWANEKIFNNTLPPKNQIIISNLLGYAKRPFVWPMGAAGAGKILMNIGTNGYNNSQRILLPINEWNIDGQVFIHELTHVWQLHTMSDINFTITAIKDQCTVEQSQLYLFTCGKAWNEYKLEQQATAAANCYRNIEKKSPTNCEEPYIVNNIRKGVAFYKPSPTPPKLNGTASRNSSNNATLNLTLTESGVQPQRNVLYNGQKIGVTNTSISFNIGNPNCKITTRKEKECDGTRRPPCIYVTYKASVCPALTIRVQVVLSDGKVLDQDINIPQFVGDKEE